MTSIDPSVAFLTPASLPDHVSGSEPVLGGALRERAVWVNEAVCIGCRYCAHVATNTFVIESQLGRSRAIRQDGDSTERIQEAIDTCPVDCIHGPNDKTGAGAEAKEPGFDPTDKQLYIDPEECIDCGACDPECPVEAIYDEDQVPEEWKKFIKINYDYFGREYEG